MYGDDGWELKKIPFDSLLLSLDEVRRNDFQLVVYVDN
jgi:hypothetical protein